VTENCVNSPEATPRKPRATLLRLIESNGMLETAASVGWKVKDAIVGFHGIGRLVER
jgi:hypothetical protein